MAREWCILKKWKYSGFKGDIFTNKIYKFDEMYDDGKVNLIDISNGDELYFVESEIEMIESTVLDALYGTEEE